MVTSDDKIRVTIELATIGEPELITSISIEHEKLDKVNKATESLQLDQYESMAKSEGFIVVDGTSGIEEQQQLVRNTVMRLVSSYKEQLLPQQQQFQRQKAQVSSK